MSAKRRGRPAGRPPAARPPVAERRRERRLRPFPVLTLAAVWVLLWGNLSVANVLAGVLLASAVLLVFPLPTVLVGLQVRPVALVSLVVRFQVQLVVASCQVAWQAVRPGPPPPSAVFTAQLRSEDELFQTLTAEILSLVPGSLVIDLDSAARTVKVHALGVSTAADVDQMRRSIADTEDRVLAAFAADLTGARRVPSRPERTEER